MLISRTHRFIFVHIYKNAGTSISSALMPFAATQWQYRVNQLQQKLGITHFYPCPYPAHSTARELIQALGHDVYRSYFSFAIVRNPWDWQVSLYTYITKNRKHRQHRRVTSLGNFDNYIRWRCDKDAIAGETQHNSLFRLQKDFVCSKSGDLLVDYVGRFENLKSDFQSICAKLRVSAQLRKLNVSTAKPYHTFYNHETERLVRRTFHADIELWGYEFTAADGVAA